MNKLIAKTKDDEEKLNKNQLIKKKTHNLIDSYFQD